MSDLYFDTNVYAQIDAEQSASDVRDWISRNHFRLRVSENVMSETFRIADSSLRRRRFATITQVANLFPQPGTFLTTRELVQAVSRRRAHWLRQDPDTDFVSRFLNLDRNTWRRLRADPGHFPAGLEHSLDVLHAAVGEVRERQRKTRARLRGTTESMIAALPSEGAEGTWRTAAALQFINSLFPEADRAPWSALTYAYLEPSRITPSDLASFWNEVAPDELPRTRLLGVADYLQRRYELTAGNWGDQGHAVEMLAVDAFVTRDGNFAKVLNDLRAYLDVRSRVVFLNSRDSILSQLAAGLGD